MKPIYFKGHNFVFTTNRKEYQPFPAFIDGLHGGRVISCWKLSFFERLRVLITGKIWDYRLTFNNGLQPIELLFNPFKVKKAKDNV